MPSLFFTPNNAIRFLLSLLVTIFFEFLIYWLILRKKPLKLLFYSVVINSLTLPIVKYLHYHRLVNFYLLEALVVLVETFLIMALMKISYKKALLVSLVANLVTALFSLYWQAKFRSFWSKREPIILR